MLPSLQRVQHRKYGCWLTIMRANDPTSDAPTSQIFQLPVTRDGWPTFVDYPPQRDK